jgi:hypothetical protein
MKEVCIVPTYRRTEMLHCCLSRIWACDPQMEIVIFGDRGESTPFLKVTAEAFGARLMLQSKHDYHGNSFNAGESLRWAYNEGYDLIHYVEDDCFVKPDWLRWTRETHEEWDDIFCSCGWVFNHHMPLVDETYFAPWIYIPQFSIRRDKLALVVEHLNPFYYRDMWKYVAETFPKSHINMMYPNVVHYEIDGLLQRLVTESKLQVAWSAISKVIHMGAGGYNRGWNTYEDLFKGCPDFASRVARIESLVGDEYWRAETFGKTTVERETGHVLEERKYRYRVEIPGGWSCDFESPLTMDRLPRKICSVPLPKEAKIMLLS